jgi:Icc-related predicted phosphoesterase
MTRLCFISDTHCLHAQVTIPDCDILVHCGDFTSKGMESEVSHFLDWVIKQEDRGIEVVYIAGNHDIGVGEGYIRAELDKVGNYLHDSDCKVKGVRFWGSPWTPAFGLGWAYQLTPTTAGPRCAQLGDCDVLVTHGPPHGTLDRNRQGDECGDRELAARLYEMSPAVHAFGHIHEGYGIAIKHKTLFINAASCNARYQPINPPIVLDLP